MGVRLILNNHNIRQFFSNVIKMVKNSIVKKSEEDSVASCWYDLGGGGGRFEEEVVFKLNFERSLGWIFVSNLYP